MPAPEQPMMRDLFEVPSRFFRSVHLERDFSDPHTLDNYIVTPAMAEAVNRVADGLRPGSAHRAWRITGDYGVGKSSFALLLAHLLSKSDNPESGKIAETIGWSDRTFELDRFWPILITGAREGIVPAILRGISESVFSARRYVPDLDVKKLETLIEASKADRTGGRAFDRLFDWLRTQSAEAGRGVVLVIDELGKLLEYAAQNPDEQDVFILQRLAETAARSGERPLLMVGLLHQGFQAYAERLPAATRHEWDKVAGRFEEIVFDQPLAHTAALISGALGVATSRLPSAILKDAQVAARATGSMGWLGGGTTSAATMDASRIYPLHPTLLPPLARFFARFGQNERSLFGFLLSGEPFGLQSFSDHHRLGEGWYSISDFYDYVRANFGHRLIGDSYQNQWLRIVNTIDTLIEGSELDLAILKTVGLLNLIDADDLTPTKRAIFACFSGRSQADVTQALDRLERDGYLFSRGERSGYRLWPNASVNLLSAYQNAKRAVGPIETVASQLGQFLPTDVVLARRHYLKTGTMRYFEVRSATIENASKVITTPTAADGLLTLILADGPEDHRQALAVALEATKDVANAIVGVVRPLLFLAPDLSSVRHWQWVKDNTPELSEDIIAAEEVSRQLHTAKRSLATQFAAVSGLERASSADVHWFRDGASLGIAGTLTNEISAVCDDLFHAAPKIHNELINKGTLSSAAAAARMRLIEGMFNSAELPLLGMDAEKAPPEKSIYLSIFKAGKLHVEKEGRFQLAEPAGDNEEADPLKVRPALRRLMFLIREGMGNRVSVTSLLDDLRQAPFGVREGLAPLLLAIVLKVHGHELAVYEDGTFIPRFSALDLQRLSRSPGPFEIQYCSVEGVRADVFGRLADAYAASVIDRQPVLLDVVQELCQFAARLPEYTRKSRSLAPVTRAVRDALTTATEPATLLFRDLPKACDLPAFEMDSVPSAEAAEAFVGLLNEAINDLQTSYGKLLERIVDRVGEACGFEVGAFDRAELANRAAKVSLHVREPRLRAFALRLRDPGLSNDAWAEALASFVVARPPAKWMPGDEARFGEEIGALAELFRKVEAAAFGSTEPSSAPESVRVNLTRADGRDLVEIVSEPGAFEEQHPVAKALLNQLGRTERIQFLTALLFEELDDKVDVKAAGNVSESIVKR